MSAKQPAVQAPALPQVNLLPPEVKAARGLARVKRWLAVALVVTLVGSAGIVGKAMLDQDAAADQLADAEDRTAALEAQKAEFAHVPVVLAALDRALLARRIGMSTEVRWRQYFEAVAAETPPGIRIENIKIVSATPMILPTAPADALSAQGVSVVAFTAQAATIPELETWLRQLPLVPGFSDPWYNQATYTALNETTGVYQITAGVVLLADAYEHRFDDITIESLELAAAEAAAADVEEDE